ncbi:MAG: carbohydrate deacetylase [Candidatus Acidiferrales bacterium]
MRATRLIVNADDFGMCRGISDGIITAYRYGFLTSTSMMPNMPAAEYALSRLMDFPRLAVGVHLNICAGRPILSPSEVRSLVDATGQFYSPQVMIRRLCTGRALGREICAEFRAQIRWMKDRGLPPTHADSHHHMHLYPAAVLPFVRALKAEGVLCARAPRCTVWNRSADSSLAARLGGPHEGSLVRCVAVRTYRNALHLGAFRGLRMPASRLSFPSRARHDIDALGDQWLAALRTPQPGTFELTCHPGFFQRGFSETDAIHAQRERELNWLTSSDLRTAIDRSGIHLITYRDLADICAEEPASEREPALP